MDCCPNNVPTNILQFNAPNFQCYILKFYEMVAEVIDGKRKTMIAHHMSEFVVLA